MLRPIALLVLLLPATCPAIGGDRSIGPTPPVTASPLPSGPAADQPPSRAWVKWLFDSMKNPIKPRRLIGNIYYVGTSGVSSFLITTPKGHFLLDTGFEDTVPLTQASIEELGFHLTDIKVILSSHAHIDHTGGHARMQRLTGARVVASINDASILESGGETDFIPFPKDMILYPPVHVDQKISEGEPVTLADVTLTPHLTPGHTRGATTWTMEVVEDGQSYHVVFFSSASINPGTRLVRDPSYPEIMQDYETTFARLKVLPCDVFFAPHGGQFGMIDKFSRLDRGEIPNPLIDPKGWKVLLGNAEKAYRDQVAAESTRDP